jgi:hypothetical protein
MLDPVAGILRRFHNRNGPLNVKLRVAPGSQEMIPMVAPQKPIFNDPVSALVPPILLDLEETAIFGRQLLLGSEGILAATFGDDDEEEEDDPEEEEDDLDAEDEEDNEDEFEDDEDPDEDDDDDVIIEDDDEEEEDEDDEDEEDEEDEDEGEDDSHFVRRIMTSC